MMMVIVSPPPVVMVIRVVARRVIPWAIVIVPSPTPVPAEIPSPIRRIPTNTPSWIPKV
jgi:hypothetical protein